MQITGSWKKGFHSFVEKPSFEYKPKSFTITKIANIKKQPIDVKQSFDIEIYVVKYQSPKRDLNGLSKSDFYIVGDTSALIRLRSVIDLEEKMWYTISAVKAMQFNNEMILITSQYSIKVNVDRNDVRGNIEYLLFGCFVAMTRSFLFTLMLLPTVRHMSLGTEIE